MSNLRSLSVHRLGSFLGLFLLIACGGKGCSGCGGMGGLAPIKGGFPVDKRLENAIELRLTQGFFSTLEMNGPGLVNQFVPGGKIDVPSSCGGNPELCCGQTCAVHLDVSGLHFEPQPPQTTRFTVRTKLRTETDMHIKYKQGIINLDCNLAYDTTKSGAPDVGLAASLNSTVDGGTKLANMDIDPNSIDLQDIDSGDVEIKGNIFCGAANLLKGLFIGTLKDTLKKQIAKPLEGLLCQKCMSNDDCSSLANQGCAGDKKVCTRDGKCMQSLGVEGHLDTGGLLGGEKGASGLDIYAVAGGYAAVENGNGGLSLGMLGGGLARPASSCVPMRAAPAAAVPPKTAAYSGNATPSGKPFHVGAGISLLELDTLGYGFFQSGGLCMSISTAQVALLSSATLGTLIRSIEDLTRGQPAAMSIVLRPQQPPTFALGKGTFKTDGMGKKTIDDPLLKIGMKDLALDFYLFMDERSVRLMRLTADVALPLSLDVDDKSQLVPILGDLGEALQNVRVTDSALLKESPQALSALFPKLFPILLGQVGSALKPIALPAIMGIQVKPVEITSTEGAPGKLEFLGLFLEAAFSKTMMLRGLFAQEEVEPAETVADLVSLEVQPAGRFALGPRHDPRHGTKAVLRVDGCYRGGGALEWQFAVDDGLWQPFDDRHEIVVDDASLSLPGTHHIDVRARAVGEPLSLDPTPARVAFLVQPGADPEEIQGPARTAGCSAAPGGSGPGWLLLVLAPLFLLRRRARWALAPLVLLAGATGGCADSDMKMPTAAGDQAIPDDEIGRYQSAVAQGDTIYISAYDSTFGDLVYAEVKDVTAALQWHVVDGLPDGAPDNTDPNAPRRGYTQPGPDVGRFTSLALSSQGVPYIAYQDASASAVKLAVGPAGSWQVSNIDVPADKSVRLGMFTQLLLGSDDTPTVGYMASGVLKDNKAYAQLVVAHGKTQKPASPDDWDHKVVDEAPMSCAGICGAGTACVYADPKAKTDTLCKPTADTCMGGCDKGKACIDNACVDALGAPAADLPQGTGLHVCRVRDGAAGRFLFYDRAHGALKVAAGPDWAVSTLVGGDGKQDLGRYPAGQLGDDGTLQVAFGDGASNHLMYRAFPAQGMMPSMMMELADDGLRDADGGKEQHLLGAGAVLFLDGGTAKVVYQDQTLGTLELATRGQAMAWQRETKGAGGTVSRGFFPQVVQLAGRFILIDVIYDRSKDTLSGLGFTQL